MRGGHVYQRWNRICTIVLWLCAGALLSDSALCQTESSEALPPSSSEALAASPSPTEHRFQIPAAGDFKIISLPPVRFERPVWREDLGEQSGTGSSPRPPIQTQGLDPAQAPNDEGLVKRSVR